MKKYTKKEKIHGIVLNLLVDVVTRDYAHLIADNVIDDVVKDVEECADAEEWNSVDVRLALGRVLSEKYQLPY